MLFQLRGWKHAVLISHMGLLGMILDVLLFYNYGKRIFSVNIQDAKKRKQTS